MYTANYFDEKCDRKMDRKMFYNVDCDLMSDNNDIEALYISMEKYHIGKYRTIEFCRQFIEFWVLYKKLLIYLGTIRRYSFSRSLLCTDLDTVCKKCLGNRLNVKRLNFIAYDNFGNKIYITFMCHSVSDNENTRKEYMSIINSCGTRCDKVLVIHLGGTFFEISKIKNIRRKFGKTNNISQLLCSRKKEKIAILKKIRDNKKNKTYYPRTTNSFITERALENNVDIEVLYIWEIENLYNMREAQFSMRMMIRGEDKLSFGERVPGIKPSGVLGKFMGISKKNYLKSTYPSISGGRYNLYRMIKRLD